MRVAKRWKVALVTLVACMSALVFAVPAVAAGLTMTGLSPTSGHVGTVVTISGTGFVTNDIVAFNGTHAAVSSVNKMGTKLTTAVPGLATSGVVTVTDPVTGQTVGLPNRPFTVTTGTFPFPNHVWAGQAFMFAGSGLTPNSDESIYLKTARLAVARTNASGDFQVGVTVPLDEMSGKMHIYALDPNLNKVQTILFVLGSWPMYRHDAQHTGYDNYETSLSVSTVPKLKQIWTKFTDPSAAFAMEPSTSYGLVDEGINSAGNFGIYAFTTDGTSAPWNLALLFASGGPEPAVANGNLYLVYNDTGFGTSLRAMDATTGAFAFTTSLGSSGSSASSPTVAGTTLYVGGSDDNLYAIDATSGKVLWTFPTGGAVNSSPAVAKGIVYVGSDSGKLFAVKATTGKQVWAATFSAPVTASPAVVGSTVYIGTDNGTVEALDAATGVPTWTKTYKNAVFVGSPAVANGVVYLGAGGESAGLYAFNTSTGSLKWAAFFAGTVTDPAVANGVVYASVPSENTVEAFNASTSAGLWSTSSITAPLPPIVSNGLVYIEGANNIYAYGT